MNAFSLSFHRLRGKKLLSELKVYRISTIYRKFHSIYHAVILLIEDFCDSLNTRRYVAPIIVDLEDAFATWWKAPF